MPDTLNVVAMIRDKQNDKFIFLYDNESIDELYDQIQVLAADEELGLTLQQVVLLCRKVRERQMANEYDSNNFE